MNGQFNYNPISNIAKLNQKRSTLKQSIDDKVYQVYDIIPKHKAVIKGYWTDSLGKVYIDGIKIRKHKSFKSAVSQAVCICHDKQQEAVFIKSKDKAYIVNKEGKVTSYFKIAIYKRLSGYKQIKSYIKVNRSGLTIHKTVKGYIAEVWR